MPAEFFSSPGPAPFLPRVHSFVAKRNDYLSNLKHTINEVSAQRRLTISTPFVHSAMALQSIMDHILGKTFELFIYSRDLIDTAASPSPFTSTLPLPSHQTIQWPASPMTPLQSPATPPIQPHAQILSQQLPTPSPPSLYGYITPALSVPTPASSVLRPSHLSIASRSLPQLAIPLEGHQGLSQQRAAICSGLSSPSLQAQTQFEAEQPSGPTHRSQAQLLKRRRDPSDVQPPTGDQSLAVRPIQRTKYTVAGPRPSDFLAREGSTTTSDQIQAHQRFSRSFTFSDPRGRIVSPPRRSSLQPDEGRTARRDFTCGHCSLKFGRKDLLDHHIEHVHARSENFVCHTCGLAFRQKQNLDRHSCSTPQPDRPFICEICKQSFGRKSILKNHISTVHYHQRKFVCEVESCRMPFGLKSDLKRHIESVHEKKRPYKCTACNQNFGRRSDLKRHRQSLHPGLASPPQPSKRPGSRGPPPPPRPPPPPPPPPSGLGQSPLT